MKYVCTDTTHEYLRVHMRSHTFLHFALVKLPKDKALFFTWWVSWPMKWLSHRWKVLHNSGPYGQVCNQSSAVRPTVECGGWIWAAWHSWLMHFCQWTLVREWLRQKKFSMLMTVVGLVFQWEAHSAPPHGLETPAFSGGRDGPLQLS